MVAIKDMEIPSCCSQCDLCVEDKYADMTCVLLGSDWEETDYNENHRDENCPLVEIEEHKVGKWIYHEKSISTDFKDLRECSCCHYYFRWKMHRDSYCPNCGAEMRGAENEIN